MLNIYFVGMMAMCKVCQKHATCFWFLLGITVSGINKQKLPPITSH